MWAMIDLLLGIVGYIGGYIPTTRWLFYSDRVKQEAIEMEYNLRIAKSDAQHEERVRRWKIECASIEKDNQELRDRSTTAYQRSEPRFPDRYTHDYPLKSEYEFRTRAQSEQRALALGLIWFGILFKEGAIATPRVVGKLLFKGRTPYEREIRIKEMDRVIAELEKSELP
jgi:hypothetical protein